MKRTMSALLGIFGLLAVSTTSFALTINSGDINVGIKDTLLAQADLGNAGDGTELAWVKSVLNGLGVDTTNLALGPKTGTDGGAGWTHTDTGDLFAFELLSNDPGWFLIKTGNIQNGQTNRDFLFANNDSPDYAVIALLDLGVKDKDILNISKVSHVDEFGSTPVPEPGTIVLLAAGLFGLGIFGRRRLSK